MYTIQIVHLVFQSAQQPWCWSGASPHPKKRKNNGGSPRSATQIFFNFQHASSFFSSSDPLKIRHVQDGQNWIIKRATKAKSD